MGQIGDAGQTNPGQSLGSIMPHAQRRDGQMSDSLDDPPIGHDAPAVARQPLGGAPRAGDCTGGVQSRPFQPGMQIVAQLGLPTEEMRYA